MGRGVLRPATGGFIGIAGSTGKERRGWQRCSPVRLAGEGPVTLAGWCRRVGAVQGARLRCGHPTGRRLGEAPVAMSSSSSRTSSPTLPPLFSSFGAAAVKGKAGTTRVWGSGLGVLKGWH
jgi:hypothetical protein